MNFWIDAQLPPNLAPWLTTTYGVNAASLILLQQGEMIVEISDKP